MIRLNLKKYTKHIISTEKVKDHLNSKYLNKMIILGMKNVQF